MKNIHNNLLLNALVIASLLLTIGVANSVHAASTLAGTLIKNQASATYKDASGVDQVATSNLVETLVQQVAAMDLLQDQTRPGALGNTLYFPHVLTNTGNDVDTYYLSAANAVGDQYDFTSVKIYADANRDGVLDNPQEITSVNDLAARAEYYFVVAVTLPATGPVPNDIGNITVTAYSDFNNSVTQTNTDSVVITNKAVVDVTKSMSASTGYSPSDVFTVSLSYANNSTETATDVTLIDSLPVGMSYVADSAKWSATGNLQLTDNDKTDSQSGIVYCAYHNDCTGLPSNGNSTQQVTAIISSLVGGASGILTFDVQIDSSVVASTLYNTAYYLYHDSSVIVPMKPSNKVPFEVLALPAVAANGSNTNSANDADNLGGSTDAFIVNDANQRATVSFDNYIRNKGNSTDTFDITIDENTLNPFPANTVFQLFKEDGFTPLLDTNNNGIVDTGPVLSNGQFKVVLKAVLPANSPVGTNGGAGFNVLKTATSSIDDTISDSVTDRLLNINTAYSVDITNNASIANGGTGVGIGAETNPVTVLSAAPGETAIFNLFVNNTSNVASSYVLEYSMSNTPFVAGNVVDNLTITFHNDGGNGQCTSLGSVMTSTGMIAATSAKQVCAAVTIPKDAIATLDASGNLVKHSIYFRAKSAITGVSDIKHDALIIEEVAALGITPDQQGQVQSGNTITYSHHITNDGNTALECINVALQNSEAGWNSLMYLDSNQNGQLDANDVLLTDQLLNPGELISVLVKLFVPATVPLGIKNNTTLTVSGHKDNGDGDATTCNGTPLTDAVVDITTVSESEVNIIKEQAEDNDCNGQADTGVFSTTSFPVAPQTCVIYRLTATNNGNTTVNNVRIDDAAPAFTVFNNTGALPSVTQGMVTGGVDGNEGVISGGSVAGSSISLAPAGQMVLTFGVKLD